MAYTLRKASPQQAKPLIGIYAESGAGKSYSALLLARGFVGPDGTIGMIETEAGRGEAYADAQEYPEIGGYEVVSMRDNFSPQNYGDALTVLEKAKVDAAIVDSGSHEWEGTGGVLDMANRSTAAGMLKWQKPKLEHKRHFMLRLTQTPIPLVIVCMRAKRPMEQFIKPDGTKDWRRSDYLSPIQADDILYEMFVHGWIDIPAVIDGKAYPGHNWHPTRYTTRAIAKVFELNEGKRLDLDTGRRLADWARGAGQRTTNPGGTSEPGRDDDWPQKSMDVEDAFRNAGTYAELQKAGEDNKATIATFPQAERERLQAVWRDRSRELKGT